MDNSENTSKPDGASERASAQAQMRKGVLELCILSHPLERRCLSYRNY